ncbi:hypothetical protein [Sphingomicrobium aestuariivivum]|uniref:hypothetical protein n=1 Tax=Sphingomicrobium aestuariivivum TaxID=1582356 RepID=UPI001FD6B8A8|nr:hypothetical protein [Sphingomicrobium aestuariivivum]MCJ8191251.1 hypothetical protein [Sphingomicrobium aestuariivivum]
MSGQPVPFDVIEAHWWVLPALWAAGVLLLAIIDVRFGGAREPGKAMGGWRLLAILALMTIFMTGGLAGMIVATPLMMAGDMHIAAPLFLLSPIVGIVLAVQAKKLFVALLGGRSRWIGAPPR